jgi:hypothetical protein
MSKEVAVKDSTLPAAVVDMSGFAEDADQGLQGVGAQDFAVPFLSILQSGSPQRKKTDGKYITGADEGMVFNTVTNELFNTPADSIIVVPVAFERKYLNWKDREEGGGLLGIYAADDPIVQTVVERKGGKEILPDGSFLSNTAQHYVLVVYPDGAWKRAVITMSSTQLKKSRRWLTIMGEKTMKANGKVFTPPTFAFKYKVSTTHESNDQGDWHGWKIDEAGQIDLATERDLYEAAKKFSKAVLSGEVKTSAPAPDAAVSGDIPF